MTSIIDSPKTRSLFEALDVVPEPLFLLTKNAECIFANQALFTFLKIDRSETVTISLEDFWPRRLEQGGRAELTPTKFEKQDGETFTVKLTAAELPSGGTLYRVVAGMSDSDSLNEFQHQRLEMLGMLAGGVAHDFNNILAGILGHTSYLKTILPATGPHVESLQSIEDGGKKGSALTLEILNFSKFEQSELPARVNVADLIKRTCRLLRGAISPEFPITAEVSANDLPVLGIETRLAQIIINLVINSRDSLGVKGAIRVVGDTVVDQPLLESIFETRELYCNKYVRLQVIDNGCGIPAELQHRIFDPYFTTKKSNGTGLGLATVNAIVRSLGGAITLQSEVGSGTCLAVYLPFSGMVAELPRTTPEPSAQDAIRDLKSQVHERILIVDDEAPVRNVLMISLEHLGYKVEVASSGHEALRMFQNATSGFDLVLLDMLMPRLSGEDVFFKLKDINPMVRVLITSGFSSERAVKNILDNGGLDFIQKPFTIEELALKVRHCLELS